MEHICFSTSPGHLLELCKGDAWAFEPLHNLSDLVGSEKSEKSEENLSLITYYLSFIRVMLGPLNFLTISLILKSEISYLEPLHNL